MSVEMVKKWNDSMERHKNWPDYSQLPASRKPRESGTGTLNQPNLTSYKYLWQGKRAPCFFCTPV